MGKSRLLNIPADKMPVHIGIIMDGNGRWAKRRMLPRSAGHKQGADTFGKIAKHCRSIGVKYLTAYAFSTENWSRPTEEINAIMDLLRNYLQQTLRNREEDVCLRFLGNREPLAADIREMIDVVERESAHNTSFYTNIALNYGGREEILHAAQALAQKCVSGELTPQEIDETVFSSALYTKGLPDVDMIIRPSGEYRISNFLPWQSVYAEMIYMDVLWPDFSPDHLETAILEYAGRARRFGGI